MSTDTAFGDLPPGFVPLNRQNDQPENSHHQDSRSVYLGGHYFPTPLRHALSSPEELFDPIDPYAFLPYGADAARTRSFLGHIYHQICRQLYRHMLLRIPSMYFTRVSRVFKESGVSKPDIKRLKKADATPKLISFRYKWESFVNTMVKEWKTLNVVSALLLSALLTMLQISDAAADPITRTAILLSLVSALMSLSYGCVYIVRFGTMTNMYKAAGFALDIRRRKTSIWWNVLVLLAMPAVWLAWSMFFFCVSVIAYVWTAGSRDDQQRLLARRAEFGPRAAVSALFLLGLIYFALVVHTFQSYRIEPRSYERAMEAGQLAPPGVEQYPLGHLPPGVYTPPPPSPYRAQVPLPSIYTQNASIFQPQSLYSQTSPYTPYIPPPSLYSQPSQFISPPSVYSHPVQIIQPQSVYPQPPIIVPEFRPRSPRVSYSPPPTVVVPPSRSASPLSYRRSRRPLSPDSAHPRRRVTFDTPPSSDSEWERDIPRQSNVREHGPPAHIPVTDYITLQEIIREWRANRQAEHVPDPMVPSSVAASSRGRSPVPPHVVLPPRRRDPSDSSESKDSESDRQFPGRTQRRPRVRTPPPGPLDIDYGAVNEIIREWRQNQQTMRPRSPIMRPSALRPLRSRSPSRQRDRRVTFDMPGSASVEGDSDRQSIVRTSTPPPRPFNTHSGPSGDTSLGHPPNRQVTGNPSVESRSAVSLDTLAQTPLRIRRLPPDALDPRHRPRAHSW